VRAYLLSGARYDDKVVMVDDEGDISTNFISFFMHEKKNYELYKSE
jgi:hypothetical protein